jgi:exopolysaccharide biosynthesis protein
LVVVDGKQPIYSEGVTLVELAQIFAKLGADRAINMDGGGSTTLVMATNNGVKVLNAPMQAKLPMQERPVANQIGFYASP